MSFFAALFQLGFALTIWAICCCAIYGALRWLQNNIPDLVATFGFLSLVFQTLGLAFLALLMGFNDGDFPEIERASYPFALLAGIILSWIGSGLLGAFLVRAATKKQMTWWESLLFYALFVAVAHAIWSFVSFRLEMVETIAQAWNALKIHLGISRWSENWAFFGAVLYWIFPFGAPLSEIVWNRVRATLKNPFHASN